MIKKLCCILLGSVFLTSAWADDLDIFSAQTVSASSPVELLFVIDTSSSMGCSVDLNDRDSGCFDSYYTNGTSKAHQVKAVLTDLLNNPAALPDDIKVGLAFYNEPGAAIVQPMKLLSETWDDSPGQPTHRDVLLKEIDALTPDNNIPGQPGVMGGGTPILGALLELGQYLNSAPVISGRARKPSPFESLDTTTWGRPGVPTYGEIARASHIESLMENTAQYSQLPSSLGDFTACQNDVAADPARGQAGSDCINEYHRDAYDILPSYNEDITSATVCANSQNSSSTVTTQIIFLTDGFPTQEQMSLPIYGARMGTWVKRWALNDYDATGFLTAAEGVALTGDAQNLGCPITANANNKLDVLDMQTVIDLPDSDFSKPFLLDAYAQNPETKFTLPGATLDTSADPASGDGQVYTETVPSFVEQANQYQSCLANVLQRFKEDQVKIHVVAFGLNDVDTSSNPNAAAATSVGGMDWLRLISDTTGGSFSETSSALDLSDFYKNIIQAGVDSATVSAALSPGVSVNPVSILSNSDDVYYPMFSPGGSSFLYGNLKKYQIEKQVTTTNGNTITTTAVVDVNGNPATELCAQKSPVNNNVLGYYECFKDTSKSFWSSETDGAVVTKGGAAAAQDIFGPYPDGERRVFVEGAVVNGVASLEELGLISLGALDNSLPASGPDANALLVNANGISLGTKNYYSQLVPNPDLGGTTTFASYSELTSHAQNLVDNSLLLNPKAYDMIRWLVGVDGKRFDSSGIYDASLAASNSGASERDLMVDSDGDVTAPTAASTLLEQSRLYHGAIVHSQPTVVNYAFKPDGDSYLYDNVIFVSGNDGFLRAIDADDGTEEYAFFPASLVENIPAMYERRPGKLQYGLDSTWTPWRQDLPDDTGTFDGMVGENNDIQTNDDYGFVRLYGGMRRGGYSYYFLDVTDRQQPKLLKEINRSSTNHDAMGQTWSQPTLAKIKQGGNSLAVAVFGGGYDPDYDFLPSQVGQAQGPCADIAADPANGISASTITCGNQIYVVKAGGYTSKNDTSGIGDIVWWASNSGQSSSSHAVVPNMNHSIPAKVKTLDKDGDGYTDRLYVGDLGGQVFRVDIDNSGDDSQFSIVTLMQAGHEGFNSPLDADRRMFFEEPSVALMLDGTGNKYIGVALASGWRENPYYRDVNDEMYFIRDTYNVNSSSPWVTQLRPDDSAGDFGTADFFKNLQNIANATTAEKGWFASANVVSAALTEAGEKAVGSPLILMGNVFWPSYIPPTTIEQTAATNACVSPPQRSRLSFARVQTGSPAIRLNNDGTITLGSTSDSDVPVLYSTDTDYSVPLSGLGVHLSNNSVSILAGTKSISVPLEKESIRKIKWELLESGKDAIPANPVSR